MNKLSILFQFLKFLMERKKFWLVPIVVVFVIVSILFIVVQGSVAAPFIYTLF